MCLSLTIQEEEGSFDFSYVGQGLKVREGGQKRIHMTGQLGVATGLFWGHFQWKVHWTWIWKTWLKSWLYH